MARTGRAARCAGAVAVVATLAGLLTACSETTPTGSNADPDQVDSVEPPEVGACRLLTLDDVAMAANATRTVECSQKHTAETYAVGDLPAELDDASYDSQDLATFAYETCTTQLREFLGTDESVAMRSVVNWAWFRPSEKAWEDGARWYRCDAVGGGEETDGLVPLPASAEGLLSGRPDDRWMVCAQGVSVDGSVKIPCSRPHDWRAVTTIKLGEADDPYPGDRVSEVQTRNFCSRSVLAWLNYPAQYDYGYTHFHEAEWAVGNRRSVCWAKTTE